MSEEKTKDCSTVDIEMAEIKKTGDYLSELLCSAKATEDGKPLGAKYNTTIYSVIVRTLNFNEEFRKDMASGKGVILKSTEAYDKRGEKIYNGLQSPFFGADYNDDNEYNERFSCECGKLIGQMYADGHTVCPDCGTPVTYSDTDLKKFGWVVLHGYSVLTPIYYLKLASLLGSSDNKSLLDMTIRVKNKKIGEEHTEDELDFINKTGYPYVGKGLTWLSTHIDDVFDWYQRKKGSKKDDKKTELFNQLKNDKDKLFASYLPIYSSALRTEMPGEKECKLYKMEINTDFQAIIRCSNDIYNIINRPRPTGYEDIMPQTDQEDIDILLAKIQENVARVFNEEFATIDGKKGIINGKLIGGRHDFTSRTIIVPGGEPLGADEVCVPYLTFLNLFKYEIIAMYNKVFGPSIFESSIIVDMAQDVKDENVYTIMNILLEESRDTHMCDVVISRNPCINVGSHGNFRIVAIKSNIDDKTLTINTRVLATMNADFDGDQVNIYRPMGASIRAIGTALDPITQYYIDGRTGYVNNAMLPAKDEVAVINELFTLTDKKPLTIEGLPDDSYETAQNYIIEEHDREVRKMKDKSKELAEESAKKIIFDMERLLTSYQNTSSTK